MANGRRSSRQRAAWSIRAGSTFAERRRWSPTNVRARAGTTTRAQGLVLQERTEESGRGPCRARTGSRCLRCRRLRVAEVARRFDGLNSPFDGAAAGTTLMSQLRCDRALSLRDGADRDFGAGREGRRFAGRPPQSPLDEERRRVARRIEAVRRRRLQQQRRRERHGRRGRTRRRLGGESVDGSASRVEPVTALRSE